jgi:hypothetical protein
VYEWDELDALVTGGGARESATAEVARAAGVEVLFA